MGQNVGRGTEISTKAGREKPLWASPSSRQSAMRLLLYRGDDVLGRLGHAELHDRLGLDLDGLPGLRVAADAGLPLCLHQASDAGDHEDTVLLGFLDGGLRQQVEEG